MFRHATFGDRVHDQKNSPICIWRGACARDTSSIVYTILSVVLESPQKHASRLHLTGKLRILSVKTAFDLISVTLLMTENFAAMGVRRTWLDP